MRLLKYLLVLAGFAVLVGCKENGQSRGTTDAQNTHEIETGISIADALAARDETSTDILVESSVAKLPAVRERIGQIKAELDHRRANNSICIGGKRTSIGKTAFICNDHDYDLLILARLVGQSISANLKYIEEFSDDPLHSGLSRAIDLIGHDPIDEAASDCVRIIFRPNFAHVSVQAFDLIDNWLLDVVIRLARLS
jgi:hypothetical protein